MMILVKRKKIGSILRARNMCWGMNCLSRSWIEARSLKRQTKPKHGMITGSVAGKYTDQPAGTTLGIKAGILATCQKNIGNTFRLATMKNLGGEKQMFEELSNTPSARLAGGVL